MINATCCIRAGRAVESTDNRQQGASEQDEQQTGPAPVGRGILSPRCPGRGRTAEGDPAPRKCDTGKANTRFCAPRVATVRGRKPGAEKWVPTGLQDCTAAPSCPSPPPQKKIPDGFPYAMRVASSASLYPGGSWLDPRYSGSNRLKEKLFSFAVAWVGGFRRDFWGPSAIPPVLRGRSPSKNKETCRWPSVYEGDIMQGPHC